MNSEEYRYMMEKLSEQVETRIHTLAHVERTWSRAISRVPLSNSSPHTTSSLLLQTTPSTTHLPSTTNLPSITPPSTTLPSIPCVTNGILPITFSSCFNFPEKSIWETKKDILPTPIPTPVPFQEISIASGDKKMATQVEEIGKQKGKIKQQEKEVEEQEQKQGQGREKKEVEEYFRKLVEDIESVEAHVVELQVLLLDYKHHLQTIHQKTTK